MDLTDKTALITGGRRIGAVVATELARKGAHVAMVYRASRTEAEETATALRALTRRAFIIQADLQDPDACRRVVDETVTEFGRLDVLVNMASVYREKALDALTLEDWNTQMSVDLRAACEKRIRGIHPRDHGMQRIAGRGPHDDADVGECRAHE